MKTRFQKFCAILLALAALCIISSCITTGPYRLKQTRNDISFAMTRYHNQVAFGRIAPAFQPDVTAAYDAYRTAFDAAVQQANSNYDAPTPDNVTQLANRLLSVLAAVPAAP
jgi:hypothetical protein